MGYELGRMEGADPQSGAARNSSSDGDTVSERASPTLALQRLGAAVLGLFLVMVPLVASFYDGGLLDYSVQAIVVAGAIGLPLTLIGFASFKDGRGPPDDLYLMVHRILTAALLIAGIGFALRDEPTAALTFAAATIVMGLLLLTRAGVGHDEDGQGDGATTVSSDHHRIGG